MRDCHPQVQSYIYVYNIVWWK